jgi:opacity protein-like surface antigen
MRVTAGLRRHAPAHKPARSEAATQAVMARPLCLMSALCLVAGLLAWPARAQEGPSPAAEGGWSFRITPYVWAAGVSGNGSSPGRVPSFDIDQDFTDVLADLDFAAMLAVEARYQRFGLIADMIYLDVSADASTPRGLVFSNVGSNLSGFVGTMYGGYRLAENEFAAVDLLAGVRLFSLDLDLDFEAGRFGHDRSFDSSETWADPVIGARGRFELGEGVFVNAGFDVGGFGVASDFTWQALGTIGYSFSEQWQVQVGYRYIQVNYAYLGDRNLDLNIAFSGPIIGVSYAF